MKDGYKLALGGALLLGGLLTAPFNLKAGERPAIEPGLSGMITGAGMIVLSGTLLNMSGSSKKKGMKNG